MKSLLMFFVLLLSFSVSAAESGIVCVVVGGKESPQEAFKKAAKGLPDSKKSDQEVGAKNESQSERSSCLFDGVTVPHALSVVAYFKGEGSKDKNSRCLSEVRTCTNGTLSGSYAYANSRCSQLANRKYVLLGDSKEYFRSGVRFCTSVENEDVKASLLKASNSSYPSEKQKSDCLFNGQRVGHGWYVMAYEKREVGSGEDCSAQDRYCNGGVLRGSYAFNSCTRKSSEADTTKASGVR